MYDEKEDQYYIRLEGGERVEVSKEVHDAYYKMRRREKYLEEQDQNHGLMHYEDWGRDRINGEDLLSDRSWNPEDRLMQQLQPDLWDFVSMLHDEYNIFYFVSLGLNDTEIAKILGLSQSGVGKHRKKLLKELRAILEREGFFEE